MQPPKGHFFAPVRITFRYAGDFIVASLVSDNGNINVPVSKLSKAVARTNPHTLRKWKLFMKEFLSDEIKEITGETPIVHEMDMSKHKQN